MSLFRRYLPLATLILAIAGLYVYGLSRVGVLSTDEPRYAAIGEAMAQTGDLITPRLWGAPWFEKPPLLYWMTAAGTAAGLGPEAAARLPVALLSLAFLGVTFFLLRREFGAEAAAISTILLATSAGWIAFSNLGLTDLPLAAFFSLAIWIALPLLRGAEDGKQLRFALIGVALGLAMLAKGLVPLVLSVPALWFLRRWWRNWWLAAVFCLLAAGPWYIAMYLRNGNPFLEDFFWKHHFERLFSASLQHVQPWYYYAPVLLCGLFPWTPLFGLLARRHNLWDRRRSFLLATASFGFLFFSASMNKLPGYLLPLLPALFVLLGACFEQTPLRGLRRWWFLPSALLIATIPLLAHALPDVLVAGRISPVHVAPVSATQGFYIAAPIAICFLARRSWTELVLVLCLIAEGFYIKVKAYPVLDQVVSARGLSREIRALSRKVCDGGINREWVYGLNFYRGVPLPPCGAGKFDFELRAEGRNKPSLFRLK